jgi:anti-sigma regulatory factor (Ser/Thr protein kinase)
MSIARPTPDLPATARRALAGLRKETGRCTSADLSADPASAAVARHVTRDALTRWNLPGITDDALTIASELATNAIAAIPPGSPAPAIILSVRYQPPDLTIWLWDIGPGRPAPASPGDDTENGRGLLLVGNLSHEWGWWPCPRGGGKVVWATLTTRSADHRLDTP